MDTVYWLATGLVLGGILLIFSIGLLLNYQAAANKQVSQAAASELARVVEYMLSLEPGSVRSLWLHMPTGQLELRDCDSCSKKYEPCVFAILKFEGKEENVGAFEKLIVKTSGDVISGVEEVVVQRKRKCDEKPKHNQILVCGCER